jgi:hypothetical protein
MNSNEETPNISITDDALTTATNNSLKRLDAEIDGLVGLAMQRTDDSVYRALASAGLVSVEPTKKAASVPLKKIESQFFTAIRQELRTLFMRPIGAVAALAMVSMATVIYYQQKNISAVREAVTEVSAEQPRQRESSQIFAALSLTFFTKIYTDAGDTLIGRARNQADNLDLDLKVVAVPEEGYELMGVELQPGQRVLIVDGLIAKSEQQRALKELLEAPDDTEGTVAIILVEY